MELILLGIYGYIIWLIFFKFKWLPWNFISQIIVITLPIFGLTAARLGLDQWKANVREKLETVDDIYRFAIERTSMARGEFLELLVVLLILFEIVLLMH